MSEPLGLIAGGGKLPLYLARRAIQLGRRLIVVAVCESVEELKHLADEFHLVPPGRIGLIINTLSEAGVREIAFVGKVEKRNLFDPSGDLDSVAGQLLSELGEWSDAAILKAIADLFEENGFELVDQRRFLDHLLVEPGVITGNPSEGEMKDARYGIWLAGRIADLGIGQSVAVKSLAPIAVEAIEGTNEMIRRAAGYVGEGIVVAKAAASDHDFRFDVPTVGVETIRVMREVKASALALEAGRCFLADREEAVSMASSSGISIIALEKRRIEVSSRSA